MDHIHEWYVDAPADASVGIFWPTLLCTGCDAEASLEETESWIKEIDSEYPW